jgi:hypothetical protein
MDIDSPINGVEMRRCLICQDDFKTSDGLGCKLDDHFVCDDDLDQYVRSKCESPLENLRLRKGKIFCPFRDEHGPCPQAFTDSSLAKHLPDATFELYFGCQKRIIEQEHFEISLARIQNETDRILHEVQEGGVVRRSEELLVQQLRTTIADPRQCSNCSFGPMDFYGCSSLTSHHGQLTGLGAGRISNACPACGWFAQNIVEWPKWNGTLHPRFLASHGSRLILLSKARVPRVPRSPRAAAVARGARPAGSAAQRTPRAARSPRAPRAATPRAATPPRAPRAAAQRAPRATPPHAETPPRAPRAATPPRSAATSPVPRMGRQQTWPVLVGGAACTAPHNSALQAPPSPPPPPTSATASNSAGFSTRAAFEGALASSLTRATLPPSIARMMQSLDAAIAAATASAAATAAATASRHQPPPWRPASDFVTDNQAVGECARCGGFSVGDPPPGGGGGPVAGPAFLCYGCAARSAAPVARAAQLVTPDRPGPSGASRPLAAPSSSSAAPPHGDLPMAVYSPAPLGSPLGGAGGRTDPVPTAPALAAPPVRRGRGRPPGSTGRAGAGKGEGLDGAGPAGLRTSRTVETVRRRGGAAAAPVEGAAAAVRRR